MPGKNKKVDLRIQKTRKALFSALPILLNRHKFAKITVHDICLESMVSRTAFYAHFKDKYDFLGQWLAEQHNLLLLNLKDKSEQQVEDLLFDIFQKYSAVLANLLEDADQEQHNLLFQFFAPDLDQPEAENKAVLTDFLAGGILQVILSYVTVRRKINKEELRKNIRYVYQMIMAIIDWNSNLQKDVGQYAPAKPYAPPLENILQS